MPTLSGSVTYCRLSQPWKAASSILYRLGLNGKGMLLVRPQSATAKEGILLNPRKHASEQRRVRKSEAVLKRADMDGANGPS